MAVAEGLKPPWAAGMLEDAGQSADAGDAQGAEPPLQPPPCGESG